MINFLKINRNYLIIAKNKLEIGIFLYLIALLALGNSSIF